jgi:hypothetical protein
MKAAELRNKRVRIIVHSTPCMCVHTGCIPLTETVEGTILKFEKMPCGPIGFLTTDDGHRICFDAGCDISAGTIEIELLEAAEATP